MENEITIYTPCTAAVRPSSEVLALGLAEELKTIVDAEDSTVKEFQCRTDAWGDREEVSFVYGKTTIAKTKQVLK